MTFEGLTASVTAVGFAEYPTFMKNALDQGAKKIEKRSDFITLDELLRELENPKNIAATYALAQEYGVETIATIMAEDEGGKYASSEESRMRLLEKNIDAGADYITLELKKMAYPFVREVADYARDSGTKVIIADHNFKRTPAKESLTSIGKEMIRLKADVLKFTYAPGSEEDVRNVLCTIKEFAPRNVIALSTGELGRVSRALGPLSGGWTTFAYVDGSQPAGPGQMPLQKLDTWIERLTAEGYAEKLNEAAARPENFALLFEGARKVASEAGLFGVLA